MMYDGITGAVFPVSVRVRNVSAPQRVTHILMKHHHPAHVDTTNIARLRARNSPLLSNSCHLLAHAQTKRLP